DGVDLLDAAGRDLILVETVGVGQDEVDVMRLAHTVVVVSVPGLGDDVQAVEPWVPPVLPASAAREEGIEALMDALDGHMAYLKTSGELDRRWRRMVGARV